MFIELTDHLRCPAAHDESFLVLIPAAMRGRTVLEGSLGCPVCHRVYPIAGGVARFGQVPEAVPAPPASSLPPAGALLAFLGLEGPGGFVALVGEAGGRAPALAEALPGVHFVVVNPPPGIEPAPAVSVIHSPLPPLKSHSCRGLVLGPPEARSPEWQGMLDVVLPGLRATGAGPVPARPEFELLASAEGWWVGSVG